jgi:hypothetical protein
MSASLVLEKLFAVLWEQYKKRVSYAAQYQSMVEKRGGKVQNDHVAFRTFHCHTGLSAKASEGKQPQGVEAIARIFEALGYRRKDFYPFEDKHLSAWHWEHVGEPKNPKLFISQLEVDRLSPATAAAIKKCVVGAPDILSPGDKELLALLAQGKTLDPKSAEALAANLARFFARPWNPPLRRMVEDVNKESQYAAWTLLHGNAVNHFTAYINEQKVKEWPDIETTVAALRTAGVPMKDEFEGARGSKLRQSSTIAATEECNVTENNGGPGKLTWSYAYYELAERGNVPGPDGKPMRFQGFLGAQATNLFEMTKRG